MITLLKFWADSSVGRSSEIYFSMHSWLIDLVNGNYKDALTLIYLRNASSILVIWRESNESKISAIDSII